MMRFIASLSCPRNIIFGITVFGLCLCGGCSSDKENFQDEVMSSQIVGRNATGGYTFYSSAAQVLKAKAQELCINLIEELMRNRSNASYSKSLVYILLETDHLELVESVKGGDIILTHEELEMISRWIKLNKSERAAEDVKLMLESLLSAFRLPVGEERSIGGAGEGSVGVG